ncbi:MAG: hypothetical protein M1510_14205 [Nitrospirae bacterium]|nr:hypothetical protein [Nitrospirota bacterium]
MRRVVITGIGAVTPQANNFSGSWDLIKRGMSGISAITRFDATGLPWKIAGEVKGFNAALYLDAKERLRLDPFVHYAAAAALMAAEDAGLLRQPAVPCLQSPVNSLKPVSSGYKKTTDQGPGTEDRKLLDSAGVIIGSSRGGITTIEREAEKLSAKSRISPFLMPSTTIIMAASYSARKLGIKGHCLGISNACASGTNALGEAFRLIKYGHAEKVLAGGTEAPLCRLCVGGYGVSGALSKINDISASRPFERKRRGFVIAEGAAVMVLEEYESALRRGARIYAEIAGYGNTTDAYHMTKPDVGGEARAMYAALEDAGISPEDIDYINAHGTSTVLGDKAETEAIKMVFKDRAGEIPVSSVKSMTGHMLAASGAFEAACTAMSIKEGVLAPTINLKEKDPECNINVITEKQKARINFAISNSFGFGGVNAVLVLKKC